MSHFNHTEFACHCGCNIAFIINPKLIALLEDLRSSLNKPIHILSGFRCYRHNTNIGGATHSQHMLGNAADIQVHGCSPKHLAEFIDEKYNPNGLGLYSSFVHVDVRNEARARWHGR